MRAWITKYALTIGIKEVEAILCEKVSLDMIEVPPPPEDHYAISTYIHGEGRDWHRTPEAALARAEQMRKAKIASLEKQIKKLQTMKFVLPDIDQSPEKE